MIFLLRDGPDRVFIDFLDSILKKSFEAEDEHAQSRFEGLIDQKDDAMEFGSEENIVDKDE